MALWHRSSLLAAVPLWMTFGRAGELRRVGALLADGGPRTFWKRAFAKSVHVYTSLIFSPAKREAEALMRRR